MGDVTERYCAKCGTTVPEEARYCTECGQEVPRAPGRDPTQVDQRGAGRLALFETLRQATRGEYDVVSEIGRGGMASVFLAHDVALDRKVAIKVFTPDVMALGATVRERFQREARTAASLSHPHIIPIYAVQQSDQILYFVMKYVEGRSLESVLREEGSLPVPMVMTILTQVGSALDYAHRKRVIHRDIKPGNILLDQEGYAIVTDFGIAKVAETEGLTLTGATVGTPAFMSPEQCMGMPVSGACDQYAMGVVSYQMLTGVLPFDGESAMTVMYKHTHEPPRHVAELSSDIPRPLANAVMRMLAKSPEDRFPDMASLIETFGALRQDEGEMRTQMISLAQKKGVQAPVISRADDVGHHVTTEPDFVDPDSLTSKLKSTPVTPIPQGRPKKKRTVWLIPTAAAAAAIILLVGPFDFTGGAGDDAVSDEPLTQPPDVAPVNSPTVPTPGVADIQIDPVFAALGVGESLTLTATAIDSFGARLSNVPITWESRDETVVTIVGNGVINGMSPGTTSVDIHATGHTTTVPVIVNVPPARSAPVETPRRSAVASVTVLPNAPTLVQGASMTMAAMARDAAGRIITGRSTEWTSSDPTTVSVSDGMVTAHRIGSAVVTATVEGRSASASVTVTAIPVATVSLSSSDIQLEAGETRTVRASLFDANRNPVTGTVAWISRNPTVATVSPAGVINAIAVGSTTIRAESDGQVASLSVTVTAKAPSEPPPVDPAVDRAQIQGVIEAYGAAIQAENVTAIRRVFPNVPQETSSRFAQFFQAVTNLVVTLTVNTVRLDGDNASVTADGRYEYQLDGSAQRSAFTLQVQLSRMADGWRITRVQ